MLIPKMYLYVKFELNIYNCWGGIEWGLKISLFSKLKGHKSAKNHRTMTKFELDLLICLTYPYVKFTRRFFKFKFKTKKIHKIKSKIFPIAVWTKAASKEERLQLTVSVWN
jgi:hypothetical protein